MKRSLLPLLLLLAALTACREDEPTAPSGEPGDELREARKPGPPPGAPPGTPSTDIAIVKAANPADHPVAAGDRIGFDITVTNNGPGRAFNVTMADALPDGGLRWSLAEAPAHCVILGGDMSGLGPRDLECGPVDLAAGEFFSVRVTAPTGADDCGTVTNSADADADNANSSVGASASIIVVCPPAEVPDITIAKFAKADPVSAGDSIGFEMAVVNNGPETAVNVTLTDTLPDTGLSWRIPDDPFQDDEVDFCSFATGDLGEQILECSPGALVAGAGFEVSVFSQTDADDCGVVLNRAWADADNDDPVSASASVTVECPDIGIVKTANPAGPVGSGDPIGFDIAVTNNGPGTAFDVTLTDALPDGGLNWSLAAGAPGHCRILGGVGGQGLECGPVDLAAGEFFSVRVTSPTDAAACGTKTNGATAEADNDDPVSDDASVLVVCPPVE